jgi:hypothetical protein
VMIWVLFFAAAGVAGVSRFAVIGCRGGLFGRLIFRFCYLIPVFGRFFVKPGSHQGDEIIEAYYLSLLLRIGISDIVT